MVVNPGYINGLLSEKEDKELGKFKYEWKYEGGMPSTSKLKHTYILPPIPMMLPVVPGPYIQPRSFHGFQTCISDCLLGDS